MGRGHLIRGIVTEEGFLYEIVLGGLVLTLTNLDELHKIRSIQGTKEKTISELSSFARHQELLTA